MFRSYAQQVSAEILKSLITSIMRYVYLHGFASGPHSRKARAFEAALADRQIELEIPELDAGDFSHLTLSGQLDLLGLTLAGDAVRLVGSSMGGYLAALYASMHPEVDGLVLLAPAFSFSARWMELLRPEQLRAWQTSGWLEVYHYGDQKMRRVHYGLFEDASRFPACPEFVQPCRIFHGIHDSVVPIGLSRQFATGHSNVRLTELDSDHGLLDVLPRIAAEGSAFLEAGAE